MSDTDGAARRLGMDLITPGSMKSGLSAGGGMGDRRMVDGQDVGIKAGVLMGLPYA